MKETRDLFWKIFHYGTDFASQRTQTDAIMMGFRAMGSDENIFTYLLRLLSNMLLNVTLGMFGTAIFFVWSVMSLIQTYQTPFFSAIAFFGLAALAAVAFVMTWLMGVYLVTVRVVSEVRKVITDNRRLVE